MTITGFGHRHDVAAGDAFGCCHQFGRLSGGGALGVDQLDNGGSLGDAPLARRRLDDLWTAGGGQCLLSSHGHALGHGGHLLAL